MNSMTCVERVLKNFIPPNSGLSEIPRHFIGDVMWQVQYNERRTPGKVKYE